MRNLTFINKLVTIIYSRLGLGDIVGDTQSCEHISTEIKIPTDFYLRLGSWMQNTMNWIIHLSTTDVIRTLPPVIQQTHHIVTNGSGSGDWFHSTGIRITDSNQLVFQVKDSRDAILGLCTQDM